MSEKNNQATSNQDFIDHQGESISNYTLRTGGSVTDYSKALQNYRQNLAAERGIDPEVLHTGEVEVVKPITQLLGQISLEFSEEELNK